MQQSLSKEACAAGKRRKDTIRPLLIVQAQAADLGASRSLDVRNAPKGVPQADTKFEYIYEEDFLGLFFGSALLRLA
jgi:hypothetical protein